MKTLPSNETNRLIKRAVVRRFVVAPAVSIATTVVAVLIANALEKKWDQDSSN